MRQIPERFSWRWWRLWRSGAIPRDVVFFDHLANLVVKRYNECNWYYDIDMVNIEKIKKGMNLEHFSRGFVDLCARVCQDLRISEKDYIKFTTMLFGKSAYDINQDWVDCSLGIER